MAVDLVGVVRGDAELARSLRGMKRQLQRKTLREPLFKGIEVVQKAAIFAAPIISERNGRGAAWMLANRARKKQLIKKNIRKMWSQIQQRRGDAGVYVTVTRPKTSRKAIKEGGGKRSLAVNARRKGGFGLIKMDGSRGATYYPNDPFYFRFQEQGTKHIQTTGFIGRMARGGPGRQAINVFTQRAVAAIEQIKLNQVQP
jgi:hypothetical protein